MTLDPCVLYNTLVAGSQASEAYVSLRHQLLVVMVWAWAACS